MPTRAKNEIGAPRRFPTEPEVTDFWNRQLLSNEWIRIPRIVDWLTARDRSGRRVVLVDDVLTDQKRAAYLQISKSIISGAFHQKTESSLICVSTEWPLEGQALELPSGAAVTLQEFKDASRSSIADNWIANTSDVDLFIRAYLQQMALSVSGCRTWLIREGFDLPYWLPGVEGIDHISPHPEDTAHILDQQPPRTRQEAQKRSKLRPAEELFDPDKLSHWSITMTIAWIIWGDIGAVREEWDDYRSQCVEWRFFPELAVDTKVLEGAIRNASLDEPAPNDPEISVFRKTGGSWRFSAWAPSGWLGLEFKARGNEIPWEDMVDALWLAAGEGKILATALECPVNAAGSTIVELPPHLWPRLRRKREPSGKALLSGPDRDYRDVRFARLEVKKLWPIGSGQAELQNRPDGTVETVRDSVTKDETTKRRIAEREIRPTFERWRARQPAGYVPTEPEDIAHMKQFGVGRDAVRELRKKFPRRKRGEKKLAQSAE